MRGFDSCYPCYLNRAVRLSINTKNKLIRSTLLRKRKTRVKYSPSISHHRRANLAYCNQVSLQRTMFFLLRRKDAFNKSRLSSFMISLVKDRRASLRSFVRQNKSSSKVNLRKHNRNKATLPFHRSDMHTSSYSRFSSKLSNFFTNSGVLNFSLLDLFYLTNNALSHPKYANSRQITEYKVNLLSSLLTRVRASEFFDYSQHQYGLPVSNQQHSALFSYVPDVVLIKFFTNRSNLIRSSKRLAMPKIIRKAVLTGSKLSVDTYALNYFSYKVFYSKPIDYRNMSSFTSLVHMPHNLPNIIGLPTITPKTHKINLNFKSNQFYFSKRNKKFSWWVRRFYRKLRSAGRSSYKEYVGNPFSKNRLANKLYRNKLRSTYSVRQVFNSLQGLNVYRSRFANLSSPVAYMYNGFSSPLVNASTATAFVNAIQPSFNIIGRVGLVPYQEFFNQTLTQYILSPDLIKLKTTDIDKKRQWLHSVASNTEDFTNIYPLQAFNKKISKKVKKYVTSSIFRLNLTPWYHNTIIRFFEYCAGNKVLLQYYLSVANRVDSESIIMYKRWIPRMASYERKLGHRFFLEEALHIIHLSFRLHDCSLLSSWLKAIIKRISFWKTRSIFRFLKYLFNNYLESHFNYLGIKGFKVRLKGKISAAGNSRKRTILFRSGKNSYSNVSLKCLHNITTISTFTGVMGFQVWIFY